MSRDEASLSERVYTIVLRVYPASFRARFETEIVEAFRDRRREASERSGIRGLIALWLRTIPDVVAHGVLERVQDRRRRPPDLRAAWQTARRILARSPGVSAVIVLTLAVGIGANVALFSVLRGVLLRPLPYPDPDRLVQIWETNPAVDAELHPPSPLNFDDWEGATGFESMAAWYLTSGTYRTEAWVEEIRSAQVTADFFRVLGVRPMLGHDFRREEVVRYGPVMLSHRVWLRLFGADSSVVGRTIVSSGQSYEIVGVMPPGFAFPDESVETWVAWDLADVYAGRPETRSWRFLESIGRLADDVEVPTAEAALDGVARGLAEAYPDLDGGWDTALTSLQEGIVGDVRPTLWLAFGAVVSLLLIACANVANLLLARVPARAREVAIRTTLGASRGRVVRELVAENLLLALVAGLLGLGMGALLLEALVALDAGRIPRLDEVRIDGTVLAFALAASAGTSLIFGLAPAFQALRASASNSIGDGVRVAGGRGQRRATEGFVASQVAVALVLLTGAGLFGRSLAELRSVDPGFDPDRVATFRVSLDPVDGTERETVTYYEGLLRRIEELPGVERVGASQTLPLNPVGNDFRRPYRPSGSALESADAPTAQMRIATPGYVETMGMTLAAGSGLPASARLDEPLVALVNETLARRLWPDGGAVGRAFEIDFREGWLPYTVVGVVADVKHYGIREDAVPEVYLSHRQVPYLAMSIVARTTDDPRAMTEALRGAVLSHVPMQPAYGFVSLEELLSAATAEERFLSVLLTVFAAIALALAATGVYGVIAYSVSQRRREIGVRMALGAKPIRVVGSVLGRAAAVAGVGTVLGLLGVVILSGALEAQLFGVSAGDPGTRAAVASGLLLVSMLAAYVPARRAAAVPPADVLRAE